MIFASVPVDLHIPPSPTQQITAISLSLEPGDNAVAMATMMFAQMNWVQLSRASQEGWLDSDLSRDLPAHRQLLNNSVECEILTKGAFC